MKSGISRTKGRSGDTEREEREGGGGGGGGTVGKNRWRPQAPEVDS